MFLSNGTIGLSLVALAAAIRTVSADGLFTDPLMFSYEPYDSGNTKTLLVSYRDDSAHENVVNYTKKMKGDGRQVKEKNHTLKKAHKLQRAVGSSGDKQAKSDKDRRLRWLQEDQAIMAGFSVLELETDDLKAEIAALSAIEGVTAVEEDSMMHIMSMEYDQKLRGGGGVAEHIREIQDAISATADELPEEDVEAQHGRRLAEETPYGINMVNASHVWPETPLANIKICVVDTGYDLGHVDLPTDGVQGYNQYNQLWSNDGNSHGTHCAGTIGAIGGNDIGVTSVNPDPSKFTFYIGKGLSDSGSGSNAGVMAAVQACVDNGAKVISMSLGGGGYSSITNAQYEDIYDQDVLIVAAAGNSGNSALSYPASYPSVVSVASLTSSGTRSSFSQYNDQVEISGPGSAVKSTVPGNNYDTYSGTSMACPHVAGVAALLWSHFPNCKNNQIRNAMINSSNEPQNQNTPGWDKYYGWGIVNAGNAYELLKNGCEFAGGDSNPPADEGLSYFALGGKDQVVGLPTPAPSPIPPCPGAQERFEVQILTDDWPQETTWTLTDQCGSNGEMMSGGPYTGSPNTLFSEMSACVDGQYEFIINDSYGDGICCGYGQGSYLVKFGTEIKSGGEFGSSKTETFGTCGSTPPPTTGSTPSPTAPPTSSPTPVPSAPPTSSPTPVPSAPPTVSPTPVPSAPPTSSPTPVPSAPPTNPPTAPVTPAPTVSPTAPPTSVPTAVPTSPPTAPVTPAPTASPTPVPSAVPTSHPTAPPTAPPTALVTPAPSSGDGAVAQEAVFDSEYGVPRCVNTGSSCDSRALLNGRGTVTNGNELNLSNTNLKRAACTDGNSGSYQFDESIDQITVTAGDIESGTPVPSGDFIIEGGRAYVTVKLYCWSTGASDTADIYLTQDASSPDSGWQFLASIPCPGGGVQTITQAFDVLRGTNQSIRVNFRYNGSPSTCSSGGYDDHDDLIFTVKETPNVTLPPTPAPTQPPTPLPTQPPTPAPTQLPTPAPTQPPTPAPTPSGPQTAYYDATLGAPKCSHGLSCDSAGLLNGRGNMTDGVETNRPSNLNSCTDGGSGTYHDDESIDRIIVTRVTGGDGDLTEGDEVTITASVWCWSTGSSSFIDFYYASDASNPVWNQIVPRERCPGGGQQTMTASVVLLQGSLQAVRANFMYGSGDPGENSCTSGNWDDTDDLVISVKPNLAAQGIFATPGKSKHDDVQGQGAIVYVEKDAEADEMEKKLQQMNQSKEKPAEDDGNGEKGKGKGGKALKVKLFD